MKKLFTLFAVLFSLTAVNAQTTSDNVGMSEPKIVPEFMDYFVITTGVSADGHYGFGSAAYDNPAYICDLKSEKPLIIFEPELENSLGVSIAGITYDNIAFVSEDNISYMYNINDGTKTYFESLEPEVGMDIWDVTSDGKMFAGNVTDETGFYCKPMYGVKQDDGTYKMFYLEYEENDAMGCKAQFSQARYITEDGKYIMGVQPDSRGACPRLIVWTLQEDGTYKFTTPIDDVLYDKSFEQPGEVPQYEDYVTADPNEDADLFNKQYDEYIKVFEDYETLYSNFTRHSSLRAFMMNRALRDNIIYAGIDVMNDDEDSSEFIDFSDLTTAHPVVYDCDNNKIIYNENIEGVAFEQLPGGGYFYFDSPSELLYRSGVVKENGNAFEFTEWLAELTGVDLHDTFYYEICDMFTGDCFADVFAGLPYFSNDGKTLLLFSFDGSDTVSTLLTFDRDLFASTSTDIEKPSLVSMIHYASNVISINKDNTGVVTLYNINGTKQGEYTINGSLNLKSLVPAGSYIAKVKTNDVTSTLKVIVK